MIAVSRRRQQVIGLLIVAAALAVGIFALHNSDENAIGEYGLIEALPVSYFVCVAAIGAVLLACLRAARAPTAVLTAGVLSLVVLVHGSATFVESQARFPVAWLHAGFIDSIITLGHTSPYFDARFSWPGFFAAGGTLTELTGVSDPTVWLRWAPIVLISCYVPLLLTIGRAIHRGWRAPWVGVIIFLVADWVGQDYFAPQTIALIIYLAVVAVILTYFRRTEPGWLSDRVQSIGSRLPKLLGWLGSMISAGRRETEPPEIGKSQPIRIALLAVLAALSIAMVSAHQLTPVVLVVVLFGLGLLGRSRPWPLFLFVGIVLVGWLSYGAEVFWKGHLDDIFGGLGQVGTVVDSGVADRIQGAPAHLEILQLRMIITLVVWGLAGLGAIRMWWSGRRVSVPALVLLGAPAFLIATQSYGGEGLLRVFLFSLPGAAMLAAGLFFPTPVRPGWRTLTALAAALVVIFGLFLFARWGNEDFERITTEDVALRQEFYRVAPLGATIGTFADAGPGSFEHLTQYKYGDTLADDWPITTAAQVDADEGDNPLGTYLIISRAQVAAATQNNSAIPADAGEQLVALLVASKQYQIIYQNSAGVLLQRVPAPTAAAPAAPAGGAQ